MAYLSCAPRRTAPRDTLVDLLWSDRSPEAGRHDLRQTVWLLRQRFGRDVVAARRGEVSLVADVTSDRDAFLEAIHGGNAERAVALYGGEYLPGGWTSATEPYEEWVGQQRYRLSRLFCGAAQEVVRGHMHGGRGAAAVELARRVRDTLPDDEDSWRLYLEALISGGRWAEVSSEADVLEWQFAIRGRELDLPTRQILRSVRHRLPAGLTSHARMMPVRLAGRDEQMGRVLRAWRSVQSGTGQHLDVAAPAGFGKTRFLLEAGTRLRALGAEIVSSAANPSARDVGHVLVSDVSAKLAALSGAAGISPGAAATLTALNPALSSRFAVEPDQAIGDEAARRRLIAFVELLQAIGEERPVVVLLDDLHWADAPSRQIVHQLLERISTIRAMVVTAARPVAPAHTLTNRSRVLHLGPLSASNVQEIIDDLAESPSLPWAQELAVTLHAITAGSPLLTLEILQEALDRGTLTHQAGDWGCPTPEALPGELEAIRRSRLQPADVHPRSLLVVPFTIPPDSSDSTLSDGFTERLIVALSRVAALRVISWASARSLRDDARELGAIAGELRARYVLHGSLRVTDSSVHITAQLTEGMKDGVIWGDSTSGPIGELSGIEEGFARAIGQALHVSLTAVEQERIRRLAIPDARAYECYARAREATWRGHTPERLRRAMSLLRAGLRFGGDHALFYSAMGTLYAMAARFIPVSGWSPRRGDICARKALRLDPESAQAHYLLGLGRAYAGDLRGGIAELLRTLAIDPSHTDALWWCTGLLGSVGKLEIARPLAQRLLEVDPLTPANLCIPGWLEWLDGRFPEAVEWYVKWLRAEPQNPVAVYSAAIAMIWNQRMDEATRLLAEVESLAPASAVSLYGRFIAAALRGDRDAAHKALTPSLVAFAQSHEASCWQTATYYVMLGEPSEAISWLERAARRGFINYPFLAEHDPFLRRLDNEAAFTLLLEHVKRQWEELTF